jgi:hypothetical protein
MCDAKVIKTQNFKYEESQLPWESSENNEFNYWKHS